MYPSPDGLLVRVSSAVYMLVMCYVLQGHTQDKGSLDCALCSRDVSFATYMLAPDVSFD
jgi:hypothetical protein